MKRIAITMMVAVLALLLPAGCNVPADDTVRLSGVITANFQVLDPTNAVTVFLTEENDITAARVYSTTVSAWEDVAPSPSIIMLAPPHYDRYASYSLSGIAEGTYYLCAEFEDTTNLNSLPQSGPVEIVLTGDTVQDITF